MMYTEYSVQRSGIGAGAPMIIVESGPAMFLTLFHGPTQGSTNQLW